MNTAARPFKLPIENIAELKASQRALHDMLPEFDKLEECGADCQQWRALHEAAMKRIDALLKHYA